MDATVAAKPTNGDGGAAARAARQPSRSVTLARVAKDARLGQDYLFLCALSSAVATLGLLVSSTAVVIGAMLISPLIAPIMGLGFGLATFDSMLLRRSLTTLLIGMGWSIVVASVVILASPVRDVTDEILSRTRPNLLDLAIAIVGGLAGVYAVLQRKDGVMTGVAIATALMPPLATVAFGIVTQRWDFMSGALLLFITNTAAIALSATLVARLSGFAHRLSARQTVFQTAVILGTIAALAVPLSVAVRTILREAALDTAARAELTARMGVDGRIDRLDTDAEVTPMRVSATIIGPNRLGDVEGAVAASIAKRVAADVDVSIVHLRSDAVASRERVETLANTMAKRAAVEAEARKLAAAIAAFVRVPADQAVADPVLRELVLRVPPSVDDVTRAAAVGQAETLGPGWRVTIVSDPQASRLPPPPPPPLAEPSPPAPLVPPPAARE